MARGPSPQDVRLLAAAHPPLEPVMFMHLETLHIEAYVPLHVPLDMSAHHRRFVVNTRASGLQHRAVRLLIAILLHFQDIRFRQGQPLISHPDQWHVHLAGLELHPRQLFANQKVPGHFRLAAASLQEAAAPLSRPAIILEMAVQI